MKTAVEAALHGISKLEKPKFKTTCKDRNLLYSSVVAPAADDSCPPVVW